MTGIKIKTVHVSNEGLSPKVLKSSLFSAGTNYPHGYRLRERYVYDYELEFIIFSEGSMIIDEQHHTIKQGDVVFRKPGQYTQGIMPYKCYLICIDMLGDTGKNPSSYDFCKHHSSYDLCRHHSSYDFYKKQDYQNIYSNPVLDAIPQVYHPQHTEKYQYLFDSVLKEFINPSQGSELILKSYVLNLLYQLYHDSTNPLVNSSIPLSPHYGTIKRVLEYIENNVEQKIMLDDLARLTNLSPNHFHKIFTEAMGITPNAYITKIKLDRAKELLIRTDLPISEISTRCGFENIPYFSYLFKKQVDVSPGEFRKRHSYI